MLQIIWSILFGVVHFVARNLSPVTSLFLVVYRLCARMPAIAFLEACPCPSTYVFHGKIVIASKGVSEMFHAKKWRFGTRSALEKGSGLVIIPITYYREF